MGSIPTRASFSFFVDRAREPTLRRVLQILTRARTAWGELESYLTEDCGLKGSLHYMYGERYGWALRFRRGSRTVLALYPNRSCLTVQLILGTAHIAAARGMGLPSRVSIVLEAAKQYPEGRWLFIPVKSQEHLSTLSDREGVAVQSNSWMNAFHRVFPEVRGLPEGH